MQPTITLARIGDPIPECTRRLAIVRSARLIRYRREWEHFPDLAPSISLFRRYLLWRDDGEWPRRWPEYSEEFHALMKRQPLLQALQQTARLASQGETLVLGCFCADARFCHRSLIGEWLAERGITVVSR